MIVTIISFRKSLIINTLNGIIGLYDNKDKQDKQNIFYWKEFIFLCYSFRSLNLFPNRMGNGIIINFWKIQTRNLIKWYYNTFSNYSVLISDGYRFHHYALYRFADTINCSSICPIKDQLKYCFYHYLSFWQFQNESLCGSFQCSKVFKEMHIDDIRSYGK
jgi:hypothetical protein